MNNQERLFSLGIIGAEDRQALSELLRELTRDEDGATVELRPETAQTLEKLAKICNSDGGATKTDLDRALAEFCEIQNSPDNAELLKIYASGFFGALACFKIFCPYSHEQAMERINWMIAQIITKKDDQDLATRHSALRLASNLSYDKNQFRAMVFDRAKINDDGNDVNPETNQITDDVIPYADVEYQRKSDGMYVPPEHLGIDRLSQNHLGPVYMKNDAYYPVRIMYAELNGEKIVIRTNNPPLIAALIKRDIAFGDPVNERYLREAVNDPELAPYRHTIFEASSVAHEADTMELAHSTGQEIAPEKAD